MFTPRPFIAITGDEDPIFPVEATEASFKKLQEIYKNAGVPKHCQLYVGQGGHRYYKDGAWPFIEKYL